MVRGLERTSDKVSDINFDDTSSVTRYSENCDKLNNWDSIRDDNYETSSVTSSDDLCTKEVQIIKEYCRVWRNIGDISHTIRRNRRHTRSRIISKLLQAGILEMEYPDKPTHPAQRYRTVYKKGDN